MTDTVTRAALQEAIPPRLKFLGWYDPDKKRAPAIKVSIGAERFIEKFGITPNICLCNADDAAEATFVDGIDVLGRSYIARHTFYIGNTNALELNRLPDSYLEAEDRS